MKKMGGLTDEQVSRFEDQGFLIVKGLLDPKEDIDPVLKEYEAVLERLIDRFFASGEISSRYDDLSFGKKIIRIQQETGKNLMQHFEPVLPRVTIKPDTPIWVGEAVFKLLSNPRLLDAVESIIGSEIFANPIQHVRMKLPESAIPAHLRTDVQLRRTPWHQDAGVVTPEAENTNLVTVWFPLWDVPVSAGPLQVLPGCTRGGVFTHCPKHGDVGIPQQLIDDRPIMILPMKRGDVLLLHKMTPHASVPNTTDDIRVSFDLRYNPIGQPSGRDAFPRVRRAQPQVAGDRVA